MENEDNRFSDYNKTTTYYRAGSTIYFYCIEYDLFVEIVFADNEKEVVKILEVTNYTFPIV